MQRKIIRFLFVLAILIVWNVPEANAVNHIRFAWHDATRNRTIPVKIFYPSKESDDKLPVIVFSHGLGGSIDCCSYLANAWASQGFAAVFLQHPGSDEQIWKGKALILNEFKEAYRHNWNGRTRAEDIRFVLDRLEQLIAANHPVVSKLDQDRIGVGGYDLGCLASLLVAGQVPSDGGDSLYDSRIKAVLAMSPPVRFTNKSFQEVYDPIGVPLLFITGTEDDSIVGSTKANQRRIPFDSVTRSNRYLVIFQGADHRIYGGRIFSLLARNDQRFQSAIIRVSNYFWKAFLCEDEKAGMILNGYGLPALLGGIATVEQRTNHTEVSQPPVSTVNAEETEETEKTKHIEEFPVTRFYRNIIQK